jgi:hypothetical protein
MIGMIIVGILFFTLYAGISSGVQVVQLARENLRATQVLVEKTETIRLNTWEQITSGTNIPLQFIELYYPASTNAGGIAYHGTVLITNVDLTANYQNDMRMILVQVRWTNYGIPRMREMQTYVARNGMQNYIF